MDFLKKNGFWIANFLLAAAMVGVWFYSTGAITKATNDRIGEIKGKLAAAEAVSRISAEEGVRAHPNSTTEDGMKVKLDKLADSITQAWKIRYDSQQDIMKWPNEILFGDAGRAFLEEFKKYDPPETLPLTNKGKSEQMKRLLRMYKQQIPSQMQNICSIIKSDWHYQGRLDRVASLESSDEEDAAESDESETDEEREEKRREAFESGRQIVAWNEANQLLWLDKLTKFQGRDDNEFSVNLPTPSQVYMLQQDLWLLEAMFAIIRNVNSEKDGDGKMVVDAAGNPVMVAANDLAAIKRIDHVVFGREALSLLGTITDTIEANKESPSGQGGRGRSGRGGRAAPGSKKGSESSDLNFDYLGQPAFHGRYVNANLEPIEAEKIQQVLTSNSLPADNLEVVVAKRVPVRLAVRMDERKIAEFLTACANSPFAFEVWQVRINRHDGKEVITLRGGSGRSQKVGTDADRGGGREESKFGTMGGGGGGSANLVNSGAAGSGAGAIAVRSNFDVGVEFYGIVKIYNPVNEANLGRKADDAAGP